MYTIHTIHSQCALSIQSQITFNQHFNIVLQTRQNAIYYHFSTRRSEANKQFVLKMQQQKEMKRRKQIVIYFANIFLQSSL